MNSLTDGLKGEACATDKRKLWTGTMGIQLKRVSERPTCTFGLISHLLSHHQPRNIVLLVLFGWAHHTHTHTHYVRYVFRMNMMVPEDDSLSGVNSGAPELSDEFVI